MKKAFLTIGILILLQSCQTYKSVPINEIEKGKKYELSLQNGQKIEGTCEKITDNSIFMTNNKYSVEFPKSTIVGLKKQKLSVLKLAGGITIGAIVIAIIARDSGKEPILEIGPGTPTN